jgi:hypothetical protein
MQKRNVVAARFGESARIDEVPPHVDVHERDAA